MYIANVYIQCRHMFRICQNNQDILDNIGYVLHVHERVYIICRPIRIMIV